MSKSTTSTICTICAIVLLACSCRGTAPRMGPGSPASTEPAQLHATPDMGLQEAAMVGNLEVVEQHIAAGTDIDAVDAYGSSPLIVAATFGRADVLQALIEAGADLDVRNADGGTALHAAAFLCRADIVRILLDNGANKYLRDNYRNTPLGTVEAPFETVRSAYETFARALGPLGLELDLERIRSARPAIAELLRSRPDELEAVDYTPLARDDWAVSTPAAEGLDPDPIARLYLDASGLSTLYALLVVRNGHLVAEKYFNDGAADQLSGRQSATKSFTSALVGIALDRGCLSGVDQKMLEFFPELAARITDPRKRQITIRNLLQMRAGYPWEGRTPPYFDALFMREDWHWLPHIVDFPLTRDPDTEFQYSNLTSHILAVITARACGTDLQSFARDNLFTPMDAELGGWTRDPDNYNWGWGEIRVTARDMATFGSLYMNGGVYRGTRIISADWVRESLDTYTDAGTLSTDGGRYFHDIGYGYQWWSANAGNHHFKLAWGHGGNLIVLLEDLDMIIVTTADPLYELPEGAGWPFEGAIVELVGKFIAALPEN